MSIYRGLKKIAGSSATPYINSNGEWEILGHSTGIKAKAQELKITIPSVNWNTRYVENNPGYHTVVIPTIDLLENNKIASIKVSGETIPELITNSENLNGAIIGAVIKDDDIIILQKGEAPKGQVIIDVIIDSLIETDVK